jgi:hypothetical protein
MSYTFAQQTVFTFLKPNNYLAELLSLILLLGARPEGQEVYEYSNWGKDSEI